MISIKFTEEQLKDLADASEDINLPEKIKKKILCLRMHHNGVKHSPIASILNISANSVTNYLKEYKDGGLAKILEDKAYRPSSSLAPFMDCLKCSFTAAPPKDVAEAMHRIHKLTGIELQETQTRNILKKLGLKYRKTGVIPGNANPQLQFEFLNEKLLPKLEEARKGERKVYFVDAAHFVLGSFLGMLWCISRVFIKSGTGRKRYNVLGALDSHSKEVISLRSTDNIDALSVCDLIDLIRLNNPEIAVTLVMDNARYQRCKKVIEYAEDKNVELLFLPAYSPNLNIIERLWKHLKKKALRNKYFNSFEVFQSAIDDYLGNTSQDHKEELNSLLSLKFQTFA